MLHPSTQDLCSPVPPKRLHDVALASRACAVAMWCATCVVLSMIPSLVRQSHIGCWRGAKCTAMQLPTIPPDYTHGLLSRAVCLCCFGRRAADCISSPVHLAVWQAHKGYRSALYRHLWLPADFSTCTIRRRRATPTAMRTTGAQSCPPSTAPPTSGSPRLMASGKHAFCTVCILEHLHGASGLISAVCPPPLMPSDSGPHVLQTARRLSL